LRSSDTIPWVVDQSLDDNHGAREDLGPESTIISRLSLDLTINYLFEIHNYQIRCDTHLKIARAVAN
jgi:hypothetical protein